METGGTILARGDLRSLKARDIIIDRHQKIIWYGTDGIKLTSVLEAKTVLDDSSSM